MSTNPFGVKLVDGENRGDLAFKLENRVKDLRNNIGSSLLELGYCLSQVRDTQLYVELGYGSIGEWLSSPEISIGTNFGHVALSIYEYYISAKQLSVQEVSQIDSSKLRDILPVVKKYPNDFDKWFTYAKTLRRIDLRKEIKKLKISEKQQEINAQAQTSPQTGVFENQFLLGETFNEMKKIPDHSVDAIITRMPVYVTQEELRKRTMHPQHIIIPDMSLAKHKYLSLVQEFTRVLKPDGAMCLLVNHENMFEIGGIVSNLSKIVRDIVWLKSNAGFQHDMLKMLRVHKSVIWASQAASPTYTFTEVEKDVWQVDNDVFFFDKLVSMVTYEQQLVFDPFSSDHMIVDVALNLKRKWLGIDSSSIADVL